MTTAERADAREWGYLLDVFEPEGRLSRLTLAGGGEGEAYFGIDRDGLPFFGRERVVGTLWFMLRERGAGVSIYPASSDTPMRCNGQALTLPRPLDEHNEVEVGRTRIEIRVRPLQEILERTSASPATAPRVRRGATSAEKTTEDLSPPPRRRMWPAAVLALSLVAFGGWWALRSRDKVLPPSASAGIPTRLSSSSVRVVLKEAERYFLRGRPQKLKAQISVSPVLSSVEIQRIEVIDLKTEPAEDGFEAVPDPTDHRTTDEGRTLGLTVTTSGNLETLHVGFTLRIVAANGTVDVPDQQLNWEAKGAAPLPPPPPKPETKPTPNPKPAHKPIHKPKPPPKPTVDPMKASNEKDRKDYEYSRKHPYAPVPTINYESQPSSGSGKPRTKTLRTEAP